ncbi:MAG: hypothetical protein IJQ48_01115, partial [Prevotella sp.]|nr:hypothetical protein [Prevotella sp.]
ACRVLVGENIGPVTRHAASLHLLMIDLGFIANIIAFISQYHCFHPSISMLSFIDSYAPVQ